MALLSHIFMLYDIKSLTIYYKNDSILATSDVKVWCF